jgi:hypothetical protein
MEDGGRNLSAKRKRIFLEIETILCPRYKAGQAIPFKGRIKIFTKKIGL